ncbi:MAG: hypothetical protein ACLU4J_15975 [Butyricimonas paravirosa]
MQNTASVQNQGWRFFVQSQNIRRKHSVGPNFNISLNQNKVLKLRNGVDEIEISFYAKVEKRWSAILFRNGPGWIRNGRSLWYDTGKRQRIIILKKVFVSVKTNIGEV